MRTFLIGAFAAFLALAPVASAQQSAGDPDLARFRSAYTSGDGLSYVVIKGEKGERVYRYGDASRLASKKDPRGYMLFTCASPHVFVPENPKDKAALAQARIVHAGEPEFAELDRKYISGCRNPFVKSALPQSKQSKKE